MCLGVAYWAGIKEIYFAVPKSRVSPDYYETSEDTKHLASSFNQTITFNHVPELENKASQVIKDWEKNFLTKNG